MKDSRAALLAAFTPLILSALLSLPASAQLGAGNVVGSVYDAGGRVLPGTTVSITNVATQETFKTSTNESGAFVSAPLVPGIYQVVAFHVGFKQQVESHVEVGVGSRVEENLTLTVGEVSDSVTVVARSPDLNTTSAGLGVVFDEKPIEELPVNSRSALALAALTPGARSPFGGDVEGQGDRGDQVYSISINGAPAGAPIVIDGMNLTLVPTNGEVNINPTVDSLSEFKIESGTLDANYGYTAGGVVNMVTRSGTNAFHGSAYEYLRNDAFDAKNYFTAAGSNAPEFRYNQFGGTFGGPLIHTRAFFFGNYEQYNYIKGVPAFTTVPTLQERGGDFSDLATSTGTPIVLYDPATTAPNPNGSGQVRQPFQMNNISAEIDPSSLAYQNTFYPKPNTTPTNAFTHTNNYEGIVRTVNTMRQFMGRTDYRVSETNNLFGRYWYYQFLTNNPTLLPSPFWRTDNMKNQNLVLGDTHVFSPRLVMDVRLGAVFNLFQFTPNGTGQNWPSKLGLPNSVPSLGLPSVSNGIPAANVNGGYRNRVRGEFSDTVTLNLGPHSVSFGVDVRRATDSANSGNGVSGVYSFSAATTDNPQNITAAPGNQYASFLIGDVTSAAFATYVGATDRQNTFAAFVQDNWKVAQPLTLNLGIRYDYQQQPFEQNNHYSSFEPGVVDSVNGLQGAYVFAGVNGQGRNFLNENYLNFGPRVGFAYTFGPQHSTVLRGGYAIYYPLQDGQGSQGNTSGFSNTTTYAPQDPYHIFHFDAGIPSPPIPPLGAALGPAAFLGQNVVYTHPNAPSPIAQQMNLTIEQALPWGLVAQATALSNHGDHFPTTQYNENSLDPQYYSLGTALQTQVPNPYYGIVPSTSSLGGPTISRLQSLLPFPYYGTVVGNFNHEGYFIAHLGEFQITERASHGLTVIAGYTVGKDIDTLITFSSAPVANGVVTYSSSAYQNVHDRAADRSLDVADVSQRGTISVLYDLPWGRQRRFQFHNALVDAVAGGWQFNDITVLQTGTPVVITGANNNLATRPNFVPGVSANLPNPTKLEWFNTAAFVNPPSYTYGNVPRTLPNVRSPGLVDFDMSLFKDFPLYKETNLSFRAEAFNIFNHPSLGKPSGAFSPGSNGLNASGSFGTITTTGADNREIQLALKLVF